MPLIQASTFIARSLPEVFAFVGDQQNAVRWQSGLVEVRRITDGPVGVGTRHAFVRKVMGRTMEAENEYVTYEPNQKIAFKTVTGPMQLQASYATAVSGDGTQLTCEMQLFKASGLAGLLLPLIAKSIQKQMTADFITLKALLERPGESESV